MPLKSEWVNNEIEEKSQKLSGNKWKWTHNNPKPMDTAKAVLKRELHSNTGLPKEERKLSNKQLNLTSKKSYKTTGKKNNK